MSKFIPSLSEQGWVTDPPKILNHLLSYYLLTDTGQSLSFQGNLTSLPQTYYKYINDPEAMAGQVIMDLENILSRYFEQVEVSCETKALTETRYALLLYAAVITSDNTKIDLSRVVDMSASGLKRVIQVNNEGEARDAFYNLT